MEGAVNDVVGNAELAHAEEAGVGDDEVVFADFVGGAPAGNGDEEDGDDAKGDEIEPGNVAGIPNVAHGHEEVA